MAKFHINNKGEPGKCRAWSGDCPFGGDEVHYGSEKEAYAALERKYGGAFKRAPKPLKGARAENIAKNSGDPEELLQVARGLGIFGAEKIALALAKNPATPAEALMEARSKTAMALTGFVELEQHPNYPLEKLTGEGAYMKVQRLSPEEKVELSKNDEVGDELAQTLSFEGSLEINRNLVSNPNNKVSSKFRGSLAMRNKILIGSAASSGRWPTSGDINKRNVYYTNKVQHMSGGSTLTQEAFTSEDMIEAILYTPSESTASEILEAEKNQSLKLALVQSMVRNPKLSAEFKAQYQRDIRAQADELNKLAQELGNQP